MQKRKYIRPATALLRTQYIHIYIHGLVDKHIVHFTLYIYIYKTPPTTKCNRNDVLLIPHITTTGTTPKPPIPSYTRDEETKNTSPGVQKLIFRLFAAYSMFVFMYCQHSKAHTQTHSCCVCECGFLFAFSVGSSPGAHSPGINCIRVMVVAWRVEVDIRTRSSFSTYTLPTTYVGVGFYANLARHMVRTQGSQMESRERGN